MPTLSISQKNLNSAQEVEVVSQQLDQHRGMYLSSGIDYPGRYSRWDLGFVNPPLEIIGYAGRVIVNALSDRGQAILKALAPIFSDHEAITVFESTDKVLCLVIQASDKILSEEERSFRPTSILPVRLLLAYFEKQVEDGLFGVYGAFGYELIYEFDPIKLAFERDDTKLFHLYLPDEIIAFDRQKERGFIAALSVIHKGENSREFDNTPFNPLKALESDAPASAEVKSLISDDEYEQMVLAAKERIKVGDIFELVLSREYQTDYIGSVSTAFKRMKSQNPSPYEFICQFGDEQLVGTSPEMFVRVTGKRIESCPISGTIRRGKNAMEDEVRIRELLNSEKDEVELSMCTDVDRNDKARLCEPGSIKLLARRTIEKYSSLFHTVDHVEGKLRPEFTGLDGFLSHMWAVTLTGAPKHNAVQIIENMENATRHYYGGAVGRLSFNGDVSTAITIRTMHIKNDIARYRVGATLVWDSEPAAEVLETKMKSAPFYHALGLRQKDIARDFEPELIAKGKKAVMIDHQDSFVHTLAEYFRRFGLEVVTYRSGITADEIMALNPDLVIHSPGPGKPSDFKLPDLIQKLTGRGVPQFGVCLGLQGMIEAFGGELSYLENPRHGKQWTLTHSGVGLFDSLNQDLHVAAYHSIVANKQFIPSCLNVIASNENGDVMAVEHKSEPMLAVQFHPESILSLEQDAGLVMIANVIKRLVLGKK